MMALRTLLAGAAFALAAPANAALDLDRASVSRLPNGLTLIILEDHSFPLVSTQMLYKSGSAAETSGKTGLAHFLEHLAFRASADFPNAGATEAIYDIGGEWHGYTAMDQTTYYATVQPRDLDLLLRIEADRMARVTIDPAAIDVEKGAVITELHSYENDPESVLQEAVVRTALQAHPYGSPMAGYVSDVASLTLADAKTYYASHYAPGNAVLAIVGDVDPAAVRNAVAARFAGVAARPVAMPNLTREPPQSGERRITLAGPVDRQYFRLAYPAPAASSPDFPAFLVLQAVLAGSQGLNLHQSGWSGNPAADGTPIASAVEGASTWLPPTRDPFLFTFSGSLPRSADRTVAERRIEQALAALRDRGPTAAALAAAKGAITRALAGDVDTTEEAAHQLAFFEGIGALDALLSMDRTVGAVGAADVRRVAQAYLGPSQRTTGWLVPGTSSAALPASDTARAAADRPGQPPLAGPASPPTLRRLASGFPVIVQPSPLTDSVTVKLLVAGSVEEGDRPADMPGFDTVTRRGDPADLDRLVGEAMGAARQSGAAPPQSEDPATRIEQLIAAQVAEPSARVPRPVAIVVSGNVEPAAALDTLERRLGSVMPGTIASVPPADVPSRPALVRERIAKPLAQGAIGYVVEGPPPNTKEAMAWRMLLYVLTHDYSGRLGRSAISAEGLVYHIYSDVRTDGSRSWATIRTGVDPAKADAMEAALRQQIAGLATNPPTAAETDAARRHLLGRDLTAAQGNDELADKLARGFVETGGIRAHEALASSLAQVTPADLAAAARAFASGTLIRVDVGTGTN